jgi:hypothetical protein
VDKDAKAVLEAVFWSEAPAEANKTGEMLPFDPARGNMPVVDTKGGPVTIQFANRLAVEVNGKLVGATVVHSQEGFDGKPCRVKIKTTDGDTIVLMRGLGLLAQLGLE